MRNKFLSRICSGMLSVIVGVGCIPPVLNASAADQCDQGVQDGYDWELWNQNYQGDVSMNLTGNGTFSCSWSGIENCLFRTGKKWTSNSPQWETLGDITMEYAADYNPNGNSYLSVYGWTRDSLVEYYIIESWGTWRPPGGEGYKGTINVDGANYDVYQTTRVNQPSIDGTTTFPQYFSVRQDGDKSTSGTVSISKHFEEWEKLGLDMGNELYEVSLVVEGYQSSGSATVTKNVITFGESSGSGDSGTTTDTPTVEPDSDGYYFNDTFESGNGDWVSRGSTTLSSDSDNYYSGSKSLYITGREDTWQGAAIELDSGAFVSGNTYSFSTAILQNSGSTEEVKLTLQYIDADGEEQYDTVASANASSGEWTKLENTSYTIPSGATNLLLYAETESTTDFYIDNAIGAVKGTASTVTTGGGTVASSSSSGSTDTGNTGTTTGSGYLKDAFAKYFKMGTCVSAHELSTGADFLINNYNSITPENELKPEAIIDQAACQQYGNNVNTQVSFNSNTRAILEFCEENGISLRGHTFVWYSQTPDWFFRENFSSSGAYVSEEIMNQRLESFIKNTFELLATDYPDLDVYSYDVCNELFLNDGGGMRPAGDASSGGSNWVRIYGDDTFVINAFTYARKYAPEGCKLYINDYNEYISNKTDDIYNMAMKLKELGLIDGIGMQSHLDVGYPSASVYETALNKFLSTGLEVQITELDITTSGDYTAQADLYKAIFEMAIENADQIPAFTIWGTCDNYSWRSSQNPLLFSQGYQPKEAYYAVMELADYSASETTTTTTTTTAPIGNILCGDANGNGEIEVADAVFILQGIADPSNSEYKLTTAEDKARADADGNGSVDAQDALAIQMYMADMIDSLPTNGNGSTPVVTTTVTFAENVSVASFESSFDDGTDGWAARGNTSLSSSSVSYCEGSGSLLITGREDTWQGVSYSLDSSEFLPGNTYSFSVAALQTSGSTQEFRFTLQYTNANGEDQYDTIASSEAASGSWVLLENTSYTIPADAENMLIYVETAENLCDFYIDAALGAAKGTKNTVNVSAGTVGTSSSGNDSSVSAGTDAKMTGTVVNGVWNSTADVSWIDTSKPMVAFTFDDGAVGTASTDTSIRIQDALTENGFHATFFYVGNWIGSNQAEVLRAYNLGFEIGNHTTTHGYLSGQSAATIQSEIGQTKDLLNSIIGGTGDFLVRPPYLSVDSTVSSSAGVPLINCGIDSGDWNGATKDQIVSKLKAAMADGSLDNQIVLMHETYEATAAAMEELLPYMKEQGWQVVSVSELFKANGKTLQAGTTYNNCK